MLEMKKILGVLNPPPKHWVGDGFHVSSIFNYQQHAQLMTPFLLLDYGGLTEFTPIAPGQPRRGVGPHPHRGFETVTIVYKGEVAHRDSTGQGGVIGEGDVQWMTAGSGILHEEYHSEQFSAEGGPMQMVQLWVNLPAKDKMTTPGYQAIQNADIPVRALPDVAGQVRVIAGTYADAKGPAHTHTPMSVWDIQLAADKRVSLPQQGGWSASLLVMQGEISVNEAANAQSPQMIVLSRDGEQIDITARSDARILLLAGEPINEPVAGYGPFVMNTQQEIRQAMTDFNNGKFGQI